ncbi:aldo/keto reductase [uncultured Corynebacterium sp.]|uniref:aldo/keto reductase n=1 Tax=uncultured Corynebacterium sp. TaxID=159447 RepID=UPI0025E569D2|nr:aldo/keto reductase [uncultured Corynebacterium sp.]
MANDVSHGTVPSLELNDGNTIPQLGLGTWRMDDDVARRCVRRAIELGYRHIDTAVLYANETGVGQGIADAIAAGDVAREDLFVTTKVWNDSQRAEDTRRSLAQSLDRLGLDYVDLLLVHWPVPAQGLFTECYREIMNLRGEGLTRSAGVANFYAEVLDELPEAPAVNQIELHPGLPQDDQVADDARRGTITQSWAPLGRAKRFADGPIAEVAEEIGRTPAQVTLRWHLQRGLVAIPKSADEGRMAENLAVTDFELSDAHMTAIAGMADPESRIGGDPRTFGDE